MCVLQQAEVLRLDYGILKRVEQLSAKSENDCCGATAVAERRVANSDRSYQSCIGGLVRGSSDIIGSRGTNK